MSPLFPLVLRRVRRGGGSGPQLQRLRPALGCEEAGLAYAPRPQLVRPSGEVSWARTEASVSSASDKEECSGSQNVFKGEVAKIITRVWEEISRCGPAPAVLGRVDSRWWQHASTSKTAALRGGDKLAGTLPLNQRCPGRALGGMRALFLFLRAIGCLDVQRWLGYSVQSLDKEGSGGPQRKNRIRAEAHHLPAPRPGLFTPGQSLSCMDFESSRLLELHSVPPATS